MSEEINKEIYKNIFEYKVNGKVVNIRTLYDKDNNPWFVGKDIANILGYQNTREAIKNNIVENDKTDYKNFVKINNSIKQKKIDPQTILITYRGLKQLLCKSRMPYSENICKILEIDILNNKVLSKEQKTINNIITVFENEKFIYQYIVECFRIDLYFTEYNLAIECDENGHKYRDIVYENFRQKYLEDKLNCVFIRYNPDEKNFNIFDVISKIYKHILKYK